MQLAAVERPQHGDPRPSYVCHWGRSLLSWAAGKGAGVSCLFALPHLVKACFWGVYQLPLVDTPAVLNWTTAPQTPGFSLRCRWANGGPGNKEAAKRVGEHPGTQTRAPSRPVFSLSHLTRMEGAGCPTPAGPLLCASQKPPICLCPPSLGEASALRVSLSP